MAEIIHVGICVSNLDASITFYKTYFGFIEERHFNKDVLEIEDAVVLCCGEFRLELIKPLKPIQTKATKDSLTTELRYTGCNHIALAVDNCQELYNQMKNDDIILITELFDNRIYFCKDPDGTRIEVKQS